MTRSVAVSIAIATLMLGATSLQAATLQSIAVTPANPSIAQGTTQAFTATGTFSDASMQDLTTQVTWASLTPAVATINSSGVAFGVMNGTSTISATLGAISGSTVLTVTTVQLQSIAVTPANPSIAQGTTQAFTATGTFSDASMQDLTSQVTWASLTPAVATINSSGVAMGVMNGSSTISATLGAISGSTVLTVTTVQLQSIAVTPANPSIAQGTTQAFTATGTFSDASMQDLTSQVTWASLTPAVATINSSGVAFGVMNGTSTISATLGAISGSTVLTVTTATLQSIAVTPANPSIPQGTTQAFTATGTFSDASTQDLTSQVTWASLTPAVATINSSGVATGVMNGSSTISATLGGITGSTVLTVTTAMLQSIAVTPANPSIAQGTTQAFTATGTFSDASMQDLTSQVTWASLTAAVATINSSGVATGVMIGTSTISATLAGITGSTVLTVTAVPTSMTANPGTTPQSTAVNTAFANPLAVTVTDAGGNPVAGVNVTFTAPGIGRSGVFSNNALAITVPTNASGVAAAAFTANGTAGGPYTVSATASGLETVNFSLTNTALPVGQPVPILQNWGLLMLVLLLLLLARLQLARCETRQPGG